MRRFPPLLAWVGLAGLAHAQDVTPEQAFWDASKPIVLERLHVAGDAVFRNVDATVGPDIACGEVNAGQNFAGPEGFEKFLLYNAPDEGLVVILESDPNDLYATNAKDLCIRIGMLGKSVK